MSDRKKELAVVVGCGTLGSRVANEIYDSGANVIVIDRNADSFQRLGSTFGGLTIVGDGCDLDVLIKADVENAQTLIAVTDFENNNIFIGQAAKILYGVNNVIVRVVDKSKEAIYKDMGIRSICLAELSANAVLDFYRGGNE